MHLKSDNAKIMTGFKADDIINELFQSSLKSYQEKLKTKMRINDFVFKSVDLLNYHLHRISIKRGQSYIDSPDWLKRKRATINPKTKDNECFEYAVTAALNYEKSENHPERISNLNPFIDQYNWNDTEFLSHSKS